MSDVTMMLRAVGRGEKQASEALLPLVYDELRRLAAARMAREAAGHTLQPTALVHEAWLRLVDDGSRTWDNRGHFFAAASEAMRRILVGRARRKARIKHGGGEKRVHLGDLELADTLPDEKLLLVDEALEQLTEEVPETARVVVLKFFGGLTNEQVAEIIGSSDRTVRRHWTFAKTWLFNYIKNHF